MKTTPSRPRTMPSNDEVLGQIRSLLECPDDDLPATLVKEILVGMLKLHDAHLDALDLSAQQDTQVAIGPKTRLEGGRDVGPGEDDVAIREADVLAWRARPRTTAERQPPADVARQDESLHARQAPARGARRSHTSITSIRWPPTCCVGAPTMSRSPEIR